MINILIPMAGAGKAFKEREYTFPKALIEINGKPMIQWVIENLKLKQDHHFTFITREEDNERYHLVDVLKLLTHEPTIIAIDKPTAGAACSALLAIDQIDNDNPLIVANADQIIHKEMDAIYRIFSQKNWDGGVVTFESVHPRWSFVRTDGDGLVVEAAEKKPISRHATLGIYYFKQGSVFIESVMLMVQRGASVGNQFYICPAYNEMILKGKKIGVFELEPGEFHTLGTPEDVVEFEKFNKLTLGVIR